MAVAGVILQAGMRAVRAGIGHHEEAGSVAPGGQVAGRGRQIEAVPFGSKGGGQTAEEVPLSAAYIENGIPRTDAKTGRQSDQVGAVLIGHHLPQGTPGVLITALVGERRNPVGLVTGPAADAVGAGGTGRQRIGPHRRGALAGAGIGLALGQSGDRVRRQRVQFSTPGLRGVVLTKKSVLSIYA